MDDRRLFLARLLALAALPRLPGDTPSPSRIAGVFPLPPPFDKQSATFVELYVEPGQHSTAHRHPGFVLGYVIEGDVRFQVVGQSERIVRAGETFWEPPGVVHSVAESASPTKPARFLAVVIAESGKPIVEPA
jgi:quercetin dioxygenase-like cupin family protein